MVIPNFAHRISFFLSQMQFAAVELESETFFHNRWILQHVNNKNLVKTQFCPKLPLFAFSVMPVKFGFLNLSLVTLNPPPMALGKSLDT